MGTPLSVASPGKVLGAQFGSLGVVIGTTKQVTKMKKNQQKKQRNNVMVETFSNHSVKNVEC